MKFWTLIKSLNTERAIEYPLALDWLSRTSGSLLEVGNVLNHFGVGTPRIVVDKYERYPGVVNVDVMDVKVSVDRIISISTIEHVGFDSGELLDRTKGPEAIKHLKSLLSPGGSFLITTPVNYNGFWDDWIFSQPETRFMKRVTKWSNRWITCGSQAARKLQYNFPFNCANGIAIYENSL